MRRRGGPTGEDSAIRSVYNANTRVTQTCCLMGFHLQSSPLILVLLIVPGARSRAPRRPPAVRRGQCRAPCGLRPAQPKCSQHSHTHDACLQSCQLPARHRLASPRRVPSHLSPRLTNDRYQTASLTELALTALFLALRAMLWGQCDQ